MTGATRGHLCTCVNASGALFAHKRLAQSINMGKNPSSNKTKQILTLGRSKYPGAPVDLVVKYLVNLHGSAVVAMAESRNSGV